MSNWNRWVVKEVISLVKDLYQMLYKTAVGWLDHEGPRLAASLSLYSLLSLAPLIILCISITSFAFGRGAAQEAVVSEVRRMMDHHGLHGARAPARASSRRPPKPTTRACQR